MATTNFNEWIIPYNPKFYKLDNALTDLKIIDWKQVQAVKNAHVGDIIYIYASGSVSGIVFKGAIIKKDKPESTIDDRIYNIPASDGFTIAPCMEIAVFREYTVTDKLTYKELKKYGLKSRLQGPCKVNNELSKYLHQIDREQIHIDRFMGDIPSTCMVPFPIAIDEHLNNNAETLNDNYSDEEKAKHAQSLSDSELKNIAIEKSKAKVKETTVTVVQRNRDPYIAEYTKRRANGICQLCKKKAPFEDENRQPYLESHHIKWLSTGGSDSIDNTAALCPNCHRRVHVLNDQKDIKILKEAIK